MAGPSPKRALPKPGTRSWAPDLGPDEDDDDMEDEDQGELLDPFEGPDGPDPDLNRNLGPEDDEDDIDDRSAFLPQPPSDSSQFRTAGGEGAMYDWTEMLRSARRERLAEQVVAPYQPPQVPVQYLTQQPHHLSSGYDEWGFEAPAVHQAGAVPSAQWQEEHSSEARNPGDTAPHDFGALSSQLPPEHAGPALFRREAPRTGRGGYRWSLPFPHACRLRGHDGLGPLPR